FDGQRLTLQDVAAVARRNQPVALTDDPAVRMAMAASVELNRDLLARGVPMYGITTGFGDSVHRQISPDKAVELQEHLVRFLGNGTGAITPESTARAAVLIRANTLARGHSAVRVELVERLLALLNAGIVPAIPEEGSVGASGDLVPLSYVAAAVTGSRTVHYKGRIRPTAEALASEGLGPLTL